MPAFVRPPDPADPALFASLVASWWGRCERWAARQERASPGRDFGPAANLALWRAAAAAGPAASFPTRLRWELRSARTLVLRRRGPAPGPLPGDPAVAPRLPDGEPDFEARIAGLPPRLREVIRLRFADGLTLAEAARGLGVTRQCVHQIQTRALDALRRGVA